MTDDLARWIDGLVEGRRGVLVQRKRERWVYSLPDAPPATHWAKRGAGAKRSEIRREAANARILASMDLGPPVVASGRADGDEWMVIGDAGGGGVHDDAAPRWPGPGEPADALAPVAGAVRRLHDAGFGFPDLTRRHTFVRGRTAWFIDAARLERSGRPATRAVRARDLAAFLFSMVEPDTALAARLRFLRDASGERGDGLRDLCRRVDCEVARLASRTRWRHGRAFVSPAYHDALAEAWAAAGARGALVLPRDLLDPSLTTLVRALPDRENRTLGRLPTGGARFFVKAYPPTRRGWSPAMTELAAADLLRRAGVPAARIAAFIEDVDAGSMVATDACAGEPLDDFLRRGVGRAERRSLARQTARIWRRMRECGLRHRDAYACHLFVARTADPQRHELRLIDLTRAGAAPWPKERWFVKDAAQLWHGAKPAGATSRDAVAWLREYFRVPRLTREAKRFARRVAAKEAAVAARQARKADRR